jgi:hypothetical protein
MRFAKIDNLKDFNVKSSTGTEIRSIEEDNEKLYVWSERDNEFPIAIQIIDEHDKTIKALGLQLFTVRREGKITHIQTKDRNQPLGVNFTVAEGKNSTINFTINDAKGDAVQLIEAMDFVLALDPSRRIKIYHGKFNEYEILPINAKPEQFNQQRYDFVRSLALIQKHTNEPMHLPETVPSLESVREVFRTAKIVEKGKIEFRNLAVNLPKSEAIELVDAYINDKIGKDSTVQINLKKMVLNKEVVIKPQLELSKLKPKSKLEELRTAIAGQNQNNVDIELEREAIDAP